MISYKEFVTLNEEGYYSITKADVQSIWKETDLAKKKEKALALIDKLSGKGKVDIIKIIDRIKASTKGEPIDKAISNIMLSGAGLKVVESADLDEAKEREFATYAAWKKAVKAIEPEAKFTGDKDIDSSFKKGCYDAEWDGEKGNIRDLCEKDGVNEDAVSDNIGKVINGLFEAGAQYGIEISEGSQNGETVVTREGKIVFFVLFDGESVKEVKYVDTKLLTYVLTKLNIK